MKIVDIHKERVVMLHSFRIQRLGLPYRSSFIGKVNHNTAFGVLGSGLSNEDRDRLISICTFDHMGDLDFAGGALPDTIDKMVKTELVAFDMEAHTSPYDYHPRGRPLHGRHACTIHVICPHTIREDVAVRIARIAFEEPFGVKRPVYLERSIRQRAKAIKARNAGWIELDNGFVFFVYKQMARKMRDYLTSKGAIVVSGSSRSTVSTKSWAF